MHPRTVLLALATSVPLLSGTASGQTTSADVTFEVPLNLTGLSSRLTDVSVNCRITSHALLSHDVPPGRRNRVVAIPVSQGKVVQTVRVVVSISSGSLQNAAGKGATYECELSGFDPVDLRWRDLHDTNPHPDFEILPRPARITGNFWW